MKHPQTYRGKIVASQNPIHEREELSVDNQKTEALMLEIRMSEGIERTKFSDEQLKIAEKYLTSSHLELEKWDQGKLVLSQSGRLIADRIVRELLV